MLSECDLVFLQPNKSWIQQSAISAYRFIGLLNDLQRKDKIFGAHNISHLTEQIQQDDVIYKLRQKLLCMVFYRNEWKKYNFFSLYAYLDGTKDSHRMNVFYITTK